jgi:hypothetical protein
MERPEPPALPLAVQRQAEEEAEEEEEPIQTAPETAVRAPEPPTLPLAVQRQAEEEEEAPIQTAPETAMRAPEPPALPLAVQRQAEDAKAEEEEPIQTAPETVIRQVEEEDATAEEPAQTFPETVMRAPEPPALPLARTLDRSAVQRQAEGEEPIQTVREEEQGTPEEQRTPAPDGTLLARVPRDAGIRVASRAQLPLIKRQEARMRPSGYGVLSRSMPVQRTAILPQARFEETPSWGGAPGQPGRGDPWAGTEGERLPSPAMTRMPVQRAAAEQTPTTSVVVRRSPDVRGEMPLPPIMTIQRQPATSTFDSTSISVVQREATEEPGTTEPKSEQDLDQLAREILPLLKRMLSVERERRVGRW